MAGNQAFGDFLRSRRARMEPEAAADPGRRRRRTPGLRREEVAGRAGISAEWYVKLEQGRAVSPSAETVEALGRALRLDAVEMAHLRALAAAGGRQPHPVLPFTEALDRRSSWRLFPAFHLTGRPECRINEHP